MRVRKLSALVGAALILVGCLILYMMMDLAVFPSDVHENKWVLFEGRLKQLEVDLHRHHETVGKLKHTIKQLINNSPVPEQYHHANRTISTTVTTIASEPEISCSIQFKSLPKTDIQMLDVYKELKFDNIDGGAWKQGWNVEYNVHQWDRHNRLKVFVVPHSHNDPGWIKTFEDYYQSQTRNILNNMVAKLSEDPRRKFIWAEISFFSLWWDEIPYETKEQVKKLVSDGQLEMVTGGWVMNDEANTHYFSMILQMMEGHQWLVNQLDFKPRNSWSIDPFGQSPTMAYLLKRMGFDNLLIQRVHYSVKKYLARNKNLEFRWRQLWDDDGSTDLFTHMMPFYSYDVPHTCGPDPKICCQFDFRRLPGYGISCPWKVPPQVITSQNVAHRAALLLDQYRKKAQLYKTNVVLAPLGDDFRYDHSSEWDAQYNNYQKIFDYWNSKPHLFVDAQFGTLSDYFHAVREDNKLENFPSLSGDFFTYADRDDHYWSGYYTSRPFYKRMDRVLLSYIRATELLFSLAWGTKQSSSDWMLAPESGLTKLLRDARRNLSLFQHHDGITGTARDHVMDDYAKKMLDAINGMQHVMQQAVHFLLSPPQQVTYEPNSEFVYFDLDDVRKHHYSIPEKTIVFVGEGLESQRIVLYNSLTWRRKELVTLRVSTSNVKITDPAGTTVPSQTSPVFQYSSEAMTDSHYDITFVADVPPLGLTTYFLHAVLPAQNIDNSMSHVKLLNFVGYAPGVEGFEFIEVVEEAKEFSIHNDHISAAFSEQGLLKAITLKNSGVTVPLHLDFARYHARPGSERSGAYLFLPDREAETMSADSVPVRVLEGPLFSQVHVHLPGVKHTVTLANTPGADGLGLQIQNIVDISDQVNCELAMRISSSIKNGDEFYTDLNGLQMIKRKRFSKLPLQANYYPMPSMAFIQDQTFRFTIVTAQPLGIGSLKEGQIEVMQDRRLNQDDNRGLGQGVTDNKPLPAVFRLIVEQRKPSCQGTTADHPASLPTIAAHVASLSLLNPLFRLLWLGKTRDILESQFTPVIREPGYDFHLIMLHTFPPQSSNAAGLVVHRQETDPCFPLENFPLSNGLLNISSLLPTQFGKNMKEASLSFLNEGKTVHKNTARPVCLMEMAAFLFPR